jgi:Cytochrome c554 and c-prime
MSGREYPVVQRARSSCRPTTARRKQACVLLVAVCCLPVRRALLAQSESPVELSQTTEYSVFARDWWPTKGTPPPEAYAGSRSCQQCHAEQASTQPTTPMANASFRSAVGVWGAKPNATTVRSEPYVYRFALDGDHPQLIAESGSHSVHADIGWTFGAGVLGQTFILENKGRLYDSQMSTFRGLHGGMAITPGHKPARPGDLESALGLKLSPKTAARCFGCHTTTSTIKDQFDPERAIPGVSCESCHGPGLRHVVAANMNLIEDAKALIFTPRSLNPVESVDFCGACHMTAADVVESNLFAPNNVRFPPYRLEKSRCWGVRGDQRLVCFACHDPHKPLVQDAGFYDQRCLSCHSSPPSLPPDRSESSPEICPKASSHCTTCHMPKYDVPEMHAKFTDHFIRIVRPGEPYPIQ